MLNDLFHTYKKIIILILLLLCGVVFWFYGCRQRNNTTESVHWEKTNEGKEGDYVYTFSSEDFTGTITFGSNGYLAADKTLPVKLVMESKKDSFVGTVKVTLPGEDGKGISYQSALNCKKGILSNTILEVPKLGNVSYFYFEILDQFGTSKLSEMIDAQEGGTATGGANQDVSLLYMGVLSRKAEELSYLSDMELGDDEQQYQLKDVSFTKDTLPVDSRLLEAFSVIVIDDYDTSILSEEQIKCLEEWVEDKGGTLILGTGQYGESVLSGFSDTLDVTSGAKKSKSLTFNTNISESDIRVITDEFQFGEESEEEKNPWNTLSVTDPCAGWKKDIGQGAFALISFSFSDTSLAQWTGRDKAVKEVFKEIFDEKMNEKSIYEMGIWYAKKTLYSFMSSQMPNTFYYGVFFILYIAVIGLFAYYMLRRIKRREYIWIIIPMIASFFTIILLVRSRGAAGGGDSSFSAFRIIDQGANQDIAYLLYQNAEGETCNANLISSVKAVEPFDYSYGTSDIDHSSLKTIQADYTINNTKNGFDLAFEEAVPGTSRLLKLTFEQPQKKLLGTKKSTSGFQAKIRTEDAAFMGSITNTSSYDYKKVLIIRGNQYMIMNGLASGEMKNIKKNKISCWSDYDSDNTLLGGGNENSVMGNVLEYLRQEYLSEADDPLKMLLIGVTEQNNCKIFKDNNVLEHNVTAIVDRISLGEKSGYEYEVNINKKSLSEEDKNSSLASDVLTQKKTQVKYTLPSEGVVWKLIRNYDDFQGSIYAYNYTTGKSDEILDTQGMSMNCQSLEPYLSEMNEMVLTYVSGEDSEYIKAPILSLVVKKIN